MAAAWMDRRNGNRNPDVYLTIASGGKFADEASICAESGGPQTHPTLAYDAKVGAVYGAWEDGGRRAKSIRGCAVGRSKQEWDVSSEDEGPCQFPVVAAGGRVVAVAYESGEEVHLRVLAGGD